jgi:chromosome segregation ATPase
MSDEDHRAADERVEELLRVNTELANEIRSIRAGRVERPRSAAVPAARLLGNLEAERQALRRELEDTRAALEDTRAALTATKADRDGLERQNQEMDAEIARLRTGTAGILRRARAVLFDRVAADRPS